MGGASPGLLRSAPSVGWSGLFLVLCLAFLPSHGPVSAYPTMGNASCHFPASEALPYLPTCPESSTGNASLEDARALAHVFAPIVHFHPLEPYHLEDPAVIFNKAKIYKLPDLFEFTGNFTTSAVDAVKQAVESPALMGALASSSTFISVVGDKLDYANSTLKTEAGYLLAGAPFENGLSKAKVYYNVYEGGNGTWVYNYNLYYPYNGCSNQELSVAFQGEYSSVQYVICPVGVHEGDWERVSVAVCAGGKTAADIKRVQYSQHGWSETLDCTKGSCPFEDDHPVSYAGMMSHANYPAPSPNWVYAKASFEFLPNLDGVFIVDRSIPDPDRMFVPTAENIVEIPEVTSITPDSPHLWAAYPGSWGPAAPGGNLSITCISDNQTVVVPCENSGTAYDILSGVLGKNPDVKIKGPVERLQTLVINKVNTTYGGGDIVGPWQKAPTFLWNNRMSQLVSPLWTDFGYSPTGRLPTCAGTGDPSNTARVPLDFKNTDVIDFIVGISVGTVGFAVVATLILLIAGCLHVPKIDLHRVDPYTNRWLSIGGKSLAATTVAPNGATISEAVPEGKASPASHEGSELEASRTYLAWQGWVFARILTICFGLCCYIVGAVLIIEGFHGLFNVLNIVKSDDLWSTLKSALVACVAVIGACDLLIAISLLVAQPDLWLRFGRRYLSRDPKRIPRLTAWASRIYLVVMGFTCIVIMSAMLAFGLGLVVTVGRTIFADMCMKVANGVNDLGICINTRGLNSNEDDICGAQVADFCNKWNDLRTGDITIGATFLLWSHLTFLILSTKDFFLSQPFVWNGNNSNSK